MAYLLKIVIFHGYVSHNQMVLQPSSFLHFVSNFSIQLPFFFSGCWLILTILKNRSQWEGLIIPFFMKWKINNPFMFETF